MSRWLSSCQFDFHVFQILAITLVAVAIWIWPAVTAFAQPPRKPDAEAAALARRSLAAKLSMPYSVDRLTTDGIYNVTLGRSYVEKLLDGNCDEAVKAPTTGACL